MLRSFRSVPVFIIHTAVITLIWIVTSAAGQTAGRQASSPDWEHVRTIGARLGVPRTLTLGAAPSRTIAVGDFDGDGHADLALGDAASFQLTVPRGDGSGVFRSAVLAARRDGPTVDAVTAIDGMTYGAASSAVSSSTALRTRLKAGSPDAVLRATHRAVVGDFNGDGLVDVAAAESGSSSLQIFLGHPDGGSAAASRIALGRAAVAIASSDFDGDGEIDLFLADGNSSAIAVLLGDGRGTFDRRQSIDVGVVAAADGLAASDIDGDGLADLVAMADRNDGPRVYSSARGASLALPRAMATEPPALPATAEAADYQRINGRSGERVTSTPAGVNVAVGGPGSASFISGTQITPSVSNGRDAIWSGGCSSGGNKRRTCTFTISGNVSVSANVQ